MHDHAGHNVKSRRRCLQPSLLPLFHSEKICTVGELSLGREGRPKVRKIAAPSHLQLIATRRGRVDIVIATIILLAIFSRK